MPMLALFLLLWLCSVPAAQAHPAYSRPIPGDAMVLYRLSWVEAGKFMRSGAVVVDGNHLAGDTPHDHAVVQQVYQGLHRKYGVGAVVNLRAESAEDADAARSASMAYLHVPVVDGSAPTPDQVARFFSFVQAERAHHQVVLWHCAGGIGRAGFFSAMTRLQEGWTTKDAVAEMFQMGLAYQQAAQQLPALNALAVALGKPAYFPPDWPYGRTCPYDYRAIASHLQPLP